MLSMTAFTLQWQSWVVQTEIMWPAKSKKYLLCGPLYQKLANSLLAHWMPKRYLFNEWIYLFAYLTNIYIALTIVRHCSKCFTNINSSFLPNNLVREVELLFPFYRKRNWKTEKFHILPKVTQVIGSRTGIQPRCSGSRLHAIYVV